MPLSYAIAHPAPPEPKPRTVLVTGAAGRIGTYFAANAPERYALRLLDLPGADLAAIAEYGETLACDLADLDRLKELFAGVDTVLHLAGDPDPNAVWNDLLATNIVGTYHVFAAAKHGGVRRVVYASSIHAVGGYPKDVQVRESDPPNPGDLYGVSKAFGEAMCRYMAQEEGVEAIAVRIAGFQDHEAAAREDMAHLADAFVSDRDLAQLFVRCIDDERVGYAVVHGNSDNRFKRLSIETARSLFGYAPEDDIVRENPKLAAAGFEGLAHALSDGQESGMREEV